MAWRISGEARTARGAIAAAAVTSLRGASSPWDCGAAKRKRRSGRGPFWASLSPVNERRVLVLSAVSISRPSGLTWKMKPSARAKGAEQTPVPSSTTSANARSVVLDQNRAGPWLGRAPGGCMALAGAFDERDAGSRATHVGEEADKTDDGLEIAQLEDAAAGDEHLVVATIRGNCPDDPGAVPT